MAGRKVTRGLREFNASLTSLTHLSNFQVLCADGFAVLSVKGFVAGPGGGGLLIESSIGADALTAPVRTQD